MFALTSFADKFWLLHCKLASALSKEENPSSKCLLAELGQLIFGLRLISEVADRLRQLWELFSHQHQYLSSCNTSLLYTKATWANHAEENFCFGFAFAHYGLRHFYNYGLWHFCNYGTSVNSQRTYINGVHSSGPKNFWTFISVK